MLENCLEAQCAWGVGHEERLAFKGRDTSWITRGRSCRVVRRGRELAGRCLRKMTSVDDYHQRREGMVAGELACSDGTCWVITKASQRRYLQNSKVSRVQGPNRIPVSSRASIKEVQKGLRDGDGGNERGKFGRAGLGSKLHTLL